MKMRYFRILMFLGCIFFLGFHTAMIISGVYTMTVAMVSIISAMIGSICNGAVLYSHQDKINKPRLEIDKQQEVVLDFNDPCYKPPQLFGEKQ